MLITNSGVDSASNRAQPILCNGCDLTDEMDHPDVTPGKLNSECTPTSKGFDVVMKSVLKKIIVTALTPVADLPRRNSSSP